MTKSNKNIGKATSVYQKDEASDERVKVRAPTATASRQSIICVLNTAFATDTRRGA
jgi:hypothetical protein